MRQQESIDLFQYWNRLRDGRTAPRRTEVEPADIKALLGDTFILESDSRERPIFRLAGTRLCAMHGRELKGFAFASLWRQRDQSMVSRLLGGVFRDKSVVIATFTGRTAGERTIDLELLLLPLEGGSDTPRALGIVSPMTRPYWLGADPLSESSLETVRVVDPDKEPLFLSNRPPVSVATSIVESAPGEEPIPLKTPESRRVRHLVVLDGGRARI